MTLKYPQYKYNLKPTHIAERNRKTHVIAVDYPKHKLTNQINRKEGRYRHY